MAAGEKRLNAVDEETRSILYQGANMNQLELLFKQDHRTLKRKLFESGIKPSGNRSGHDVWAVHEVAPWLIKPAFDIEAYVRRMDPRELPKMLTKEYWAGQRSKQEYEKNAGNLWPTEKVVEEVGELMKLVKMSTLLTLDGVERQSELTGRQKEIIKSLMRGMLADMITRIQERFKVPEPYVEQQKTIDDQEV